MLQHNLAALAAVVLTVASQVLLKLGVRRVKGSSVHLFLNLFTISAYGLLVVATLFGLYAYTVIPLKAAVVLLPLTLLLVWGASFWLLHERLSRTQVVGAMFILLGLSVFFL